MNKYQEIVQNLIDQLGDWFLDEEKLRWGRMTKDLYPYEKLFSPIQVNSIIIKNRIVMGPMGNISMAEEMGRPSIKMIKYFSERAKGGVGLITTGLVPVSHYIDPTVTEKGDRSYFPRIDKSRTVFAGWRDIAESVHAYGAKIFIQLTPGLGRVGSPECLIKKFKLPVSASWNPNFYIPNIPCRPLTDRGLYKIIKNAGQAAADAKASLMDGVYLHGHEGYLLEQLTNPAFNRRKWGKFSDWQAFGIELVKEIRRRVGPDYPIMYRIDLSLALNETYKEKMDKVKPLRLFKNERTVEQTLEYMKNLVKAGVDMFDVDLGCYDNWWLPHPPNSMPPGCFLIISKIVKDYFRENNIKSNKGLDIPIVAVGKLGYPDLAEKALREDMCDMVMLARPLLADPEWCNKAYAGRVEDITPCIGDQEGCINEFIEGGHPQCAVNPKTGNEDLYSEETPAREKKKIAVVGAGPAGIMCAITLAKRGHDVTLYDKKSQIGGTLLLGAIPKIKYDIVNYLNHLEHQVKKAEKVYGLKLELNKEASADLLKSMNYDIIVCATGTKEKKLNVEGIDLPHVVTALNLLQYPELANGKENVVIVGGGAVGCEIAYWLAYEKNKNVTVIEMLPYFMKGVCTANRGHIIHYLERKNVKLLNCTRLKSIKEDCVLVARKLKNVPDPYAVWQPILPENIENPFEKKIGEEENEFEIKADLVVMAVGLVPDDSLYYQCIKERAAQNIYNIGDAFSPAKVFEAVKAGYLLGRSL
ncbi:2-enoate reductase [Caldicoprobacter guelmensis]|uniref:FAD-dependent oxidoreductase n=1 Tax=Caldicoprobacter guelmensis TaxID=1170224 RepID=UPI0019561B35|nr:FAD-dependent oxidoreductase [Caldicoprobacter guelmensis]MBM7582728.1 2-enoate reductase [Caldicoprobacter guelmensis]